MATSDEILTKIDYARKLIEELNEDTYKSTNVCFILSYIEETGSLELLKELTSKTYKIARS